MFLSRLILVNFKNYEHLQVAFDKPVNCFTGKNGSGKTNLLDAVHFLSFGRSFINYADRYAVRDGATGFEVCGLFTEGSSRHEIKCSFRLPASKEVSEDEEVYSRLSEHIGKYPMVLISPLDHELITEGSEMRRKFADALMAQLDPSYLQHLIAYQQGLKQRNAWLRSLEDPHRKDPELLEVYNSILVKHGDIIYSERRSFLERLRPYLLKSYAYLTDSATDHVSLEYQSELKEQDFASLLRDNFERDCYLQRTGSGPHRDDFLFQMDEQELKRRGSQGQQKCFLIALKLAEYELLSARKARKPILLMDDIFDKLDEERIERLLHLMHADHWGQVFMTDARPGRSKQWLQTVNMTTQADFFTIEQGQLIHDEPVQR